MVITSHNILLVGSILLLLSIFAGKTTYKLGVPTLILFLIVGMLAGSDGIGGIYFDNPVSAQFIGVVALNIILFSGGLDTRWDSVKPVLGQGITLATVGVFLTAGSVGLFIYWISDFTLLDGLLLGSIVSSTDAAAVFSILRSKGINLKGNIRPILELESGSNDPMAYFLTITLVGIEQVHELDFVAALGSLFFQFALGGASGFLFGKLSKLVINKIKLDFEGLYPVLALTLCFITFSVTDFIGGNGFLAVYICAVMLGNTNLIHKSSTIKFFDGVAWLMQIILFLTLGLLVFPSQIIPIISIGLPIALFMILVARPLSVFVSLAAFRLGFRTKLFISWVGLRGAVPIVFATYPMVAGVENADVIFNIVFFITLLSVTIQGTTISFMAKLLGVKDADKVPEGLSSGFIENVKGTSSEILVRAGSSVVGKKIYQLGIPPSVLVVMIKRDKKYFVPGGATELVEGDFLYIIGDDISSIDSTRELFA
ncbi:MAG: potassium/proton antiporter [Imperialibacter sp.]|uniref:potassium/proton antiporter n=1 Tax=Imperialibacter sp. TaxID=2038411 RepID=UPI0032ED3DFC